MIDANGHAIFHLFIFFPILFYFWFIADRLPSGRGRLVLIRHPYWEMTCVRCAQYKEPVPLMGRSAILGEQRNNYFCDVGCGRGEMGDSTYAITKTGLLCEFNNRRLLDKWVELRVTTASSAQLLLL